MNKGIKFRLYPNKQQRELINRTFGCCRLVYNNALATRKDAFESGHPIGYKETSANLTAMKQSRVFGFLKDVDSIALQQSLRDLDTAYKKFLNIWPNIQTLNPNMITTSHTGPSTKAITYAS